MENKNVAKQKKSKVRSLMGNVVGAGAAVVVVAVALSSTVEAYFRELFVFEDKIIYNIEVVEIYDPEEGEPQNLPIRLVVQDQFGTTFIPLTYGQTYGEVPNLKPNNLYNFKIQLQKDVGWITLASESVSTYPDLAGAVYSVDTNMNYLSNKTDLVFNVFVQQGIEQLEEIYLEIIVSGVVYKESLGTGDQQVTIEDFTLSNRSVDVKLYAQIEGADLRLLHEKEFVLRPFINSQFSFNYTSTETLELISTINTRNYRYFLTIYNEGKFVEVREIKDPTMLIQVKAYSEYSFNIVGRLLNQNYDLLTYNLKTQAPPFGLSLLYEYPTNNLVQLQVYALDSEIFGLPYVFIDGVKVYFTLESQQLDASIFTLELQKNMVSFNIYLDLIGQPNIEYIIDSIGE